MSKADRPTTATRRLRAGLLDQDKERRAERSRLFQSESKVHTRRNDLLPRLQLESRAPASLTAPVRNVRRLDPAHIQDVASSIAVLGFSVPVVIDQDGGVLDGLVRLEAAKLLGLASVPCIVADHLTGGERRMLRLAANRLGEKGTWDLPALKLEFEELILDKAPLEISGFELAEIDGLLVGTEAPVHEPGPLDIDADAQAVSRVNDVYVLGGRHRVKVGDALSGLQALMNGQLATMVCTDQPYNVPISGHVTSGAHREFGMASGELTDDQFGIFNVDWITTCVAHLTAGGVLATFIDWRGLPSVTQAAVTAGLSQLNLVVWAKTNAGMGSLYRSQHELFPIFKKGEARHINNVELGRKGRHRSNLWSYPGASSIGSDARQGLRHHPTVKPVAMLVDVLHDLTNRGDIVLDPFLGSGSTLLAAETSGRICHGVELDPLYVDLMIRRYQEMTKEIAVLEATGESFDHLQRRREREKAEVAASAESAQPSQEGRRNRFP